MGELCTMGDLCEAPNNMDGARVAQRNRGEFTLGDEQPPQQTQMSTVELYKGINLDLNSGDLIADTRVYPNQIPDDIMKLVAVRRAEYLRAQEQKNKTKKLDAEQEESNQLPMALSHLPVEVHPKPPSTQQAYSKRQEAASGQNIKAYSKHERVNSKRSEQPNSQRSVPLSNLRRPNVEQERYQEEAGHPTEQTRVKQSSLAGQEYQHDVGQESQRSGPKSHHTSNIQPRGYDLDSKAQTVTETSGVAGAVMDPVYGTPTRVGAGSQKKQTPTIVMRKPAQALSIGRPENARPVFTEDSRRNSQKRRRKKRSRRRRKNFCC